MDSMELVAGMCHKINQRLAAVQYRLFQRLGDIEDKVDCLTRSSVGPPPTQISISGPDTSPSQSSPSVDAPPATPLIAVTSLTPAPSLQSPTRPILHTLEHMRSPEFSASWLVSTPVTLKKVALIYCMTTDLHTFPYRTLSVLIWSCSVHFILPIRTTLGTWRVCLDAALLSVCHLMIWPLWAKRCVTFLSSFRRVFCLCVFLYCVFVLTHCLGLYVIVYVYMSSI